MSDSDSSQASLDQIEKVMLNDIAKDNTIMRRKLKYDTLALTGRKASKKTKRTTEKSKTKDDKKSSKEKSKKSSKATNSPIMTRSPAARAVLRSPAARAPLSRSPAPRSPVSRSPAARSPLSRSPLVAKAALPTRPVPPPKPQKLNVVETSSPDSTSPAVAGAKPKVKPAIPPKEDTDAMKQKLAQLEKMQEMYKKRINELEQQVSSFSAFHGGENAAVIQEVVDKRNEKLKDASRRREHTPTSALPVPGQTSLFEGHRRPKESVNIPNQSIHMDIPVASIQSKFLDHFAQIPKVAKTPSVEIVVKPKLLALYDYETDLPGRVSFKEGDILFLRKRSANGWWTVELNGKVGKIPSNHVETLDASKAFRARVVKDFKATQSGDMNIKRGELLTVLKKQDNGWWLGERGGSTGFFPSKSVEKVTVSNPDA